MSTRVPPLNAAGNCSACDLPQNQCMCEAIVRRTFVGDLMKQPRRRSKGGLLVALVALVIIAGYVVCRMVERGQWVSL